MKKTATKIAAIALALGMVLGMSATAMASQPPTTADISFASKPPIIIPPDPDIDGFEAMNLKFGARNIPTQVFTYVGDGTANSVTLNAAGTAITEPIAAVNAAEASTSGAADLTAAKVGLVMEDGSTALAAWSVQCQMTAMASGATNFSGTIYLKDGETFSSNTSIGSLLKVKNNEKVAGSATDNAVRIEFGPSAATVKVFSTDSVASMTGRHRVFWTNSNVFLTPTLDTFSNITANNFSAQMTWTLVNP